VGASRAPTRFKNMHLREVWSGRRDSSHPGDGHARAGRQATRGHRRESERVGRRNLRLVKQAVDLSLDLLRRHPLPSVASVACGTALYVTLLPTGQPLSLV
jgi:hypothetical protein